MKAGIGILLVFTGITLGYLVLAGKLPLSTGTIPGIQNTIVPHVSGSPPVATVPHVSGSPPGTTPIGINIIPHQGGGMMASIPDSYAQGQIKAGSIVL